MNVKSFEYRKNDRGYQLGDILYLEEWNPDTEKYTGRVYARFVSFILYGGEFGIPEDYCIMALQPI